MCIVQRIGVLAEMCIATTVALCVCVLHLFVGETDSAAFCCQVLSPALKERFLTRQGQYFHKKKAGEKDI